MQQNSLVSLQRHDSVIQPVLLRGVGYIASTERLNPAVPTPGPNLGDILIVQSAYLRRYSKSM